MVYTLKVNSQKLVKFIKCFKISTTLDLKLENSLLFARNIDLKDYSAVLEGQLELIESDAPLLYFSIEPQTILSKLDLFKQNLVIALDDLNYILKISSLEKKGYQYTLECNFSTKIKKNIELQLLDSVSVPSVSFEIESNLFLESMKALTNVHHILDFNFFKSPIQILVNSARSRDLSFQKFTEQKIQNYFNNSERDVVSTEIYYATTVFNNFLRFFKTIKIEIYENFMVFYTKETIDKELTNFKMYVPIREELSQT